MFQCVTPDGLLCLLGMNSPSHNIYRGSRLPLWLLGGLGQVQSYRLRGKKEKGKRGAPPPPMAHACYPSQALEWWRQENNVSVILCGKQV